MAPNQVNDYSKLAPSSARFQNAIELSLYILEQLSEFARPEFPSIGTFIQPGALGPLWPADPPEWFRSGRVIHVSAHDKLQLSESFTHELESTTASPLSLFFDLEEFSEQDIVEIISLLSDLYRGMGGDGLVIDRMRLLDPALLPEPMGV